MKVAVRKLSKDALSQEEFAEALWIADMYTQNRSATVERFLELDEKTGIPIPTHTRYPIKYRGVIRSVDYYCKPDFKEGIRFTRNFVENASAHVVSCAKLLLEKLDSTARTNIPLGPLVDHLGTLHTSQDLVSKLCTFNKIVYVRAKHDWNVPLRPKVHLFDMDDAIMIYFIARKLGKQILDEGKLKLPK